MEVHMLGIGVVRKLKKGEKLGPSHFDVLFNGKPISGKRVAARALLSLLKANCLKNIDREQQFKTAVNKMPSEKTSQLFTLPGSSKIVEEFVIDKGQDGEFFIEDDSFTIREDYLPNDDDAPDRVQQIVDEYLRAVNELTNLRITTMGNSDEFKSQYTTHWTVSRTEDGDEYSLAKLGNNGEMTDETESMLNKDKVLETLFVYGIEHDSWSKQRALDVEKLTVTADSELLNGLNLGSKEGRIVPLNVNQFSEEVQETIAEVSMYFNVA